MADYYVIKIEECPNCDKGEIKNNATSGSYTRVSYPLDGLGQDTCRKCKGTGTLESRVPLREALEKVK